MTHTTHFAPKPQKLSRFAMGSTPVISVNALAGVSSIVRSTFGEQVLRRANQIAILDIEAIEDKDCFIPHVTMTTFIDAVARLAGASNFGLMVAPNLTMANYGCWGAYVLSAPTLGGSIERAVATLGFHANGDRLTVSSMKGQTRLSYVSAAKGQNGYGHIACGVAGVLISLCKSYLPYDWRPKRIELDLSRPASTEIFEDTFGCPVHFDAMHVAVWLDDASLGATSTRHSLQSPITIEDLARARIECSRLHDFRDVIAQQIWSQVNAGWVSIESAARSVNTSVRNLQRQLNREGTDFRTLANSMRTKRAIELLQDRTSSITNISMTLGYSSPAHFSRAFHKATGVNPRNFRLRSAISETQ